MNCNSGQLKIFTDEVVTSMTELAKKHGLEDVIVRRESDPVMVAARGCLKNEKGVQGDEKIEFVMQISPSFEKAERRSLVGSEIAEDVSRDIFRAFDLSEVVAKDSVAKAAQPEDKEC